MAVMTLRVQVCKPALACENTHLVDDGLRQCLTHIDLSGPAKSLSSQEEMVFWRARRSKWGLRVGKDGLVRSVGISRGGPDLCRARLLPTFYRSSL